MTNNLVRRSAISATTLSAAVLLATAAHAAVNISTDPTQNMSCSGGVCMATAQKAYLNVNDVANYLAAGDLKIVSGAGAEDIHIQAPFSWTSTSRLTLDAQRSIEFKQPVTVAGTGALTLITDGGTDGDYWFDAGASVTFWDTSSSLIINGQSFTLVKNIKRLAARIAANPSGNFALAKSYNARHDGAYSPAAIPTPLYGSFEGLGNVISKLSVSMDVGHSYAGMFSSVGVGGSIRDINLSNASVIAKGTDTVAGTFVGQVSSGGRVSRSHATGKITGYSWLGGLAGVNFGTVTLCSADVDVIVIKHAGGAGGLVGGNTGAIVQSYANGNVGAQKYNFTPKVGALVGRNDGFTGPGTIEQSYATGAVQSGTYIGGLIGYDYLGTAAEAYATGAVADNGQYAHAGLVADSEYGAFDSSYWDITTTGQTLGCNGDACDTVVGLSDDELKSALPPGFDPQVWGQSANINNGYPYLLANPPPSGTKAAAHRASNRKHH